MSPTLDDLKAAVEAQGTVIGSAVTLLNGLGDMIRQHADDPVKVRQIADSVQSQAAALAAAVTANTPTEPPVPPAGGTQPRHR